jgi:hypothetical protein
MPKITGTFLVDAEMARKMLSKSEGIYAVTVGELIIMVGARTDDDEVQPLIDQAFTLFDGKDATKTMSAMTMMIIKMLRTIQANLVKGALHETTGSKLPPN